MSLTLVHVHLVLAQPPSSLPPSNQRAPGHEQTQYTCNADTTTIQQSRKNKCRDHILTMHFKDRRLSSHHHLIPHIHTKIPVCLATYTYVCDYTRTVVFFIRQNRHPKFRKSSSCVFKVRIWFFRIRRRRTTTMH